MNPGVYIFIGQSGAGKGTQADLLEKKIKSLDEAHGVLYIETGKKFRELIESKGFTAGKVREYMNSGRLPPPFLGIHAWTHAFIEQYDGTSHVIIDGTPRVPTEVPILLSASAFYGWEPHIIFIDVGDEWAYEKIKGRGRSDDINEQDVWGRIEWFHQSVIPTIQLLKESSIVKFHTISGQQTIEEVHRDICFELGLR